MRYAVTALLCAALALSAGAGQAQVSSQGFGPYRWGMTLAEAQAAGAREPLAQPFRMGEGDPAYRLAERGRQLLDRPADFLLAFDQAERLACVLALVGGPDDAAWVGRWVEERFGERGATHMRVPGESWRVMVQRGTWDQPGGLRVQYRHDGWSVPNEARRPSLMVCGMAPGQRL